MPASRGCDKDTLKLEGKPRGDTGKSCDGPRSKTGDTEPLRSLAPHTPRAKAGQLFLGPRN